MRRFALSFLGVAAQLLISLCVVYQPFLPQLLVLKYGLFIVATAVVALKMRVDQTAALRLLALYAVFAIIAEGLGWDNIASAIFACVLLGVIVVLFLGQRRSKETDPYLNVLLITRHIAPDVGGTETFVGDFLKYAASRGNLQIEVVAIEPLGGRIGPPSNVTLTYISWPWLTKMLWEYRETKSFPISAGLFVATCALLAIVSLRQGLRNKPDVIYGVGGPIANFVASAVGRLLGRPIVLHFHRMYRWSSSGFLVRTLIRALYNGSTRIVGNSSMIEEDARNLGLPDGKAVGIMNWVDQDIFYYREDDRPRLREEFDFPEDKTVLLFVGLFDRIKHADRIASALEALDEPDVIFVFAGHGPLEGDLRSLRSRLCDVRILGLQQHQSLADLATASDVHFWGSVDVAYPGLVVMESMRCGCPVITSSVTMNDRWDKTSLVDATTFGAPDYAWTFPPDNEGIRAAIKFARESRHQLRSIRSDVALFASKRFGYDNAERLVSLLREAALDVDGE